MKLDQNLFGDFSASRPSIPRDAEIVVVSDMFVTDYVGGAELTLEALLSVSPYRVCQLRSSEVTMDNLREGAEKYWIFGNYTMLDQRLIPVIAQNLRYSIIECDYKFCRHRSPEKHAAAEGKPCDCHTGEHCRTVIGFMAAADHVWWMSEGQRAEHLSRFPFLVDYQQRVLSSVFDDAFFAKVAELRASNVERSDKWLVLESPSWIKGTQAAVEMARKSGLEYELVGNLPYEKMLTKLRASKGLIFLPPGKDTCPRLVIEAKLLGCQLLLNENVQHKDEEWFATDDIQAIEDYLRVSPAVFWGDVRKHVERDYSLSGYTTTLNCDSQGYPFEESIESLLGFCEEVIVVDGGSTDGTLRKLAALQAKYPVRGTEEGLVSPPIVPDASDATADVRAALEANLVRSRLRVFEIPRDWSYRGAALFDGMQKAEARARCSGDFVWQQDVDEVVREQDRPRIRELVKNFPKSVPMIAFPVVEFWGSYDKVRLDVTPWKWRMSRNSPRITHGIPVHLRARDAGGFVWSKPGSDGCDPIDRITGEPIVFLGFLTNEMEAKRQQALAGDTSAQAEYEAWFTQVVDNVPTVFHFSWLNIERKIRLYATNRGTFGWSSHWEKLSGNEYQDTPENNMFFDKKWSDVTDDDIRAKAKELAEKTGGHVFHRKYDGHCTPWMTLAGVARPPRAS